MFPQVLCLQDRSEGDVELTIICVVMMLCFIYCKKGILKGIFSEVNSPTDTKKFLLRR